MYPDTKATRRLLTWFDRNRRDLPWRLSTGPYPVWISEIMLQQTQVDRVVPYFSRFLERFPTVESLAAATADDVLTVWSGLGYYRRARSLHAAARQIVARGSFPDTFEGWKELPGVGDYTAAAIASISFGRAIAAIDGNVERVVARWRGLGDDLKKAPGRRRVRELAEELLDARRPGDSNQALMELGATVCRPRHPSCAECPLSTGCVALGRGDQHAFPKSAARRATVKERRLCVVVEEAGRILVLRRSDDEALLGGLWEVPWVPWSKADEAVLHLSEKYGGRWIVGATYGRVRHTITHRNIHLEVHRGSVLDVAQIAEGSEARWCTRDDLEGIAVSSLVVKILDQLRTGN